MMNKIIILIGLLLVGAIVYYSSYLIEKTVQEERLDKPVTIKKDVAVETQNLDEADMKVKDSIIEEIPLEDIENIDIEEENENKDVDVKEDMHEKTFTESLEKEIEEQEALMDEAKKFEEDNDDSEPVVSVEEAKEKAEKLEAGIPILETEEEKIIREEEEKNKAAMEEDNVSE